MSINAGAHRAAPRFSGGEPFICNSVEREVSMRIYTSYPEVCQTIRQAEGDMTIWCANRFLCMQAVRYAQFKKPRLRFTFRAAPASTAPRLVVHNLLPRPAQPGRRPLLTVVH